MLLTALNHIHVSEFITSPRCEANSTRMNQRTLYASESGLLVMICGTSTTNPISVRVLGLLLRRIVGQDMVRRRGQNHWQITKCKRPLSTKITCWSTKRSTESYFSAEFEFASCTIWSGSSPCLYKSQAKSDIVPFRVADSSPAALWLV